MSALRRVAGVAALAAAIGSAPVRPAAAWIPEPERAWAAIAQTNAAAGRTKPVEVPVSLIDASGALAATGLARLEPGGRSHLELHYTDGATEVQERTPTGSEATRNGVHPPKSLALLPPFGVLQASSPGAVAEALRAMGGDPARVDLGIEGSHDCWVLGGRDPGAFDANTRPSLWVDQESQQAVRIDDASGTQYRFGAPAVHQGVRLPTSIEIRAPGWPSWRIDLQPAAPPAPPASAPH